MHSTFRSGIYDQTIQWHCPAKQRVSGFDYGDDNLCKHGVAVPVMTNQQRLEFELNRKKSRKARPGGRPILINILRNWVHQAMRYMDAGELITRLLIELIEIAAIWLVLILLFTEANHLLLASLALLIVHTWNWVTNGLFWVVVIFAFPKLHNPGANKTVDYLNKMRDRLASKRCISGIAIYGSVARGTWHDRSDIDIRLLRQPGAGALWCAALLTMRERFQAFIDRQPMDLYLADDIDFLQKMRSDEIPVIILCRNDRLRSLYPDCAERPIELRDLLSS